MEKENSEKSTLTIEDFQQLEVFIFAKDLEKFSNLIVQISTFCFEFYTV